MNVDQLAAMIAQYAQEGKDASALHNDYIALAAAGKTPLGLNQWVKSDKPLMEDFNEDNRIIDEKLRELTAGKLDNTAPVMKTLALVNNYTDKIRVVRNAAGERYLYINVYKPTIGEELIATLPAGFRPSVNLLINGLLLVSSPNRSGQCIFSVTTEGDISVTYISDSIFTRAIGNIVLI